MIRIRRISKPAELTDEVQKNLTFEYLSDNKKAVWNKPYIKTALLKMTHGKCCYCEKKVGVGFTDMHVEHFKPKSLYPMEVINWNNLLPACSDCNRNKSNHDTCAVPIVNPADEDPREFFYLKDYMYRSFDTSEESKANATIEVLGLNDLDKKCIVRYEIATKMVKRLLEICDYAKLNIAELPYDIRKRNKVVHGCRDLLYKCVPSAEYSAFTATALQTDSNYIELKKILIDTGQWNEELEALDKES